MGIGTTSSSGRWPVLALTATLLLVLGFAGGWSLQQVFGSDKTTNTPDHATVKVQPGSVGSSVLLPLVVTWESQEVGVNQAVGVVTEISKRNGDTVAPDDVLYLVDEVPVIAAQGVIPMFRDITPGTRGRDVEQLQQLLRASGFLREARSGAADNATVAAIRQWQKAHKQPSTGFVARGAIIFLPQLPVTLRSGSDELKLGMSLSGGEHPLAAISSAPTFTVSGTSAQMARVPDKAEVTFQIDDQSFKGVLGPAHANQESGNSEASVLPADGTKSICREKCTVFPSTAATKLQARVLMLASRDGLTVPTAALKSTPEGKSILETVSGEALEVSVVQEANGVSLITGAHEGQEVKVPSRIAP